MLGNDGSGQYTPKPKPDNHPFWSTGDHVNSERFYIKDKHGVVEVDESIVWNPEYDWIYCEVIGKTTVYIFEFSG